VIGHWASLRHALGIRYAAGPNRPRLMLGGLSVSLDLVPRGFAAAGRAGPTVSEESTRITLLLQAAATGDQTALARVVPFVYDELHRLAQLQMRRERPGHTLGATGLVHEAFIRLSKQRTLDWVDRGHFFAVASLTMRRVLVDWARSKRRLKRDGDLATLVEENTPVEAVGLDPEEVLSIDAALEGLSGRSSRAGKVVECRYFGGLTVEECAAALEVSPATVKREWRFAKTWLKRELSRSPSGG
jgi:RNA polymerase sigma factor (TIGR02999 family)